MATLSSETSLRAMHWRLAVSTVYFIGYMLTMEFWPRLFSLTRACGALVVTGPLLFVEMLVHFLPCSLAMLHAQLAPIFLINKPLNGTECITTLMFPYRDNVVSHRLSAIHAVADSASAGDTCDAVCIAEIVLAGVAAWLAIGSVLTMIGIIFLPVAAASEKKETDV